MIEKALSRRWLRRRGERADPGRSSAREASRRTTHRENGRDFLDLFVLSGFAVAPVFSVMSRTPEFFTVRKSTSGEIVLLALVLIVVPPVLLMAGELAVAWFVPRARPIVHAVFVAGLAAFIALEVLIRASTRLGAATSGWLLVLVAASLGSAAAFVYRRFRFVRAYLAFLTPGPLIFAGLFLMDAPVTRAELPAAPSARTPPPIVMVVFDEFPLASLLDRRNEVDGVRYPNFAALASDSLWFRNATAVHDSTEFAVPAILTSRVPRERTIPSASEQPENLFSLLAPSYRLEAKEPLTDLCGWSFCAADTRRPFGRRFAALASDAGLILLFNALPSEFQTRLPRVSDAPAAGRREGEFRAFVRSLENASRPTFFFLHILLPHHPWGWRPSGVRYDWPDPQETSGILPVNPPGRVSSRWGQNRWLVEQGWQRHLLQVGFTDRLVGSLVERLRALDLYDRALIIVTADHGVSFRPGGEMRYVTRRNVADIASVPLFVKLPHERDGRIMDDVVRTTDVLPTIAEIVGIRVPWGVEGRSLVGARPPDGRTVEIRSGTGAEVTVRRAQLEHERSELVKKKIELFGEGTSRGLIETGPRSVMLGRDAADSFGPAAAARLLVDQAEFLRSVDPRSKFVPSLLTGRVVGNPVDARRNLAIAVNGRVAAVVPVIRSGNEVRFSALVDPSFFRPGFNAVTGSWSR